MASSRRTRRACVVVAALLALAGCGGSAGPLVTARAADKDCSDFATGAAAQRWFAAHPGDPDHLDGDGNGVACDALSSSARTAAQERTGTAAQDRPAARTARVVAVVDGDTIKVRFGGGAVETVRLVGIDTPESKRPQTPVECGAKRAAAAMHELLDGRPVTLRRDPTQDALDRYGRTLAYVDLNGRDAGETMIRAGWAKPYVYENVPFQRVTAYRAAESAAARAHAGVHGTCSGDFHRAG